jgi:hypothetical protein
MSTNPELPDIHRMYTSPTKRSLQRDLLRRIIHYGEGLRLDSLTVACLPGETAWDIDYFLQYKKVSYIIGIERDEEVAKRLEERFADEPRVEIFLGTVSEFLMNTDYKLNFLYLDYCASFGLSVIQDIDILLRKQLLTKSGRCLVSFFNAREGVTSQIAQRRLFEDLDDHYPCGESWETMELDRRRCVAFNALLHRYRIWPTRALGHNKKRGEPRYVGASAVHLWHRYKTVGGSMLTGYFTISAYGNSNSVHRDAAATSPDKWYVRGKWSLKDKASIGNMNGLNREAKKLGRDLHREFIERKIIEFYRKHQYTPTQRELVAAGGKKHPKWGEVVRGTGLCPAQRSTVDDIRGELRRIHERDGVITLELLQRARLAGKRQGVRRALHANYGTTHSAYRKLLDELGLPHDLQTKNERRKVDELRAWVTHLESGGKKLESPLYQRMLNRGFRKYEDAVRELRRLQDEVSSRGRTSGR